MKKFKLHFHSFLLLLLIISIKFILISGLSVALAQPASHLEQDMFNQVGKHAYGETGQPLDVRIIVVRIINVFLGLLATIFLILLIIAGFHWMTSSGNQEKAKGAKDRIKNALIGLLIIMTSWGISYFILIRLRAIAGDHGYYLDPPVM